MRHLLLFQLVVFAVPSSQSAIHHGTTMDSATASTSGVTPPPLLPPTVAGSKPGDPLAPPQELWQPWSNWVCNCAAGAMSRVRDLSYRASGFNISKQDLDRQRFQRILCSYSQCSCEPGQCDHDRPDCPQVEDYLCAIHDMGYSKARGSHKVSKESKGDHYWDRISIGVHTIWDKLKRVLQARKTDRKRKGVEDQITRKSKKRKRRTGTFTIIPNQLHKCAKAGLKKPRKPLGKKCRPWRRKVHDQQQNKPGSATRRAKARRRMVRRTTARKGSRNNS
ncbi:uncharacterized protein [Ambystoma mexicanum]|uniref:uncharacterized protein n=1 Tax=Ambystoma mexicanum TaxID=8296 RepID=UPI0037E74D97